jgi:hypothetical protein
MNRLVKLAILSGTAKLAAAYAFRRQRIRHAGDRRHFLVSMGGSAVRASDALDDAVASVMMGGLMLDLRQARPTKQPVRLEVLAIMGGVQLIVPEDWNVRIDVEAVMGGIRDGRAAGAESERPLDLLVSGTVLMGGLEIASRLPAWWQSTAS